MLARRILIVRPGALGDTVLTIPLIHTIQRSAPRALITFLGTRRYHDVLPETIECQDFESPQWLWLFAQDYGEVRNQGQVFDLAYVILSRPDDVTRNLLRSGTRMVKEASPKARQGISLVLHLHQSLGLPAPQPEPALRHAPRVKRQDVIWVHPGSGGPSKCLPLASLVALMGQLKALTGYRMVVTMSEEDAFLTAAPEWDTLVGDPTTVVLKDLPLKDLCRHMSTASLFVGNDSGISHLAAALGVPAVVMFISTDPIIWAPWTDPLLLHLVDLRDRDLARLGVKQIVSGMRAFIRSSEI